jgi:DNA polymerase (family X)
MGGQTVVHRVARINGRIAQRFDAVASLLERQGANRFRVQAYRDGAATLRRLVEPVADLHQREGLEGLERLPAIGPVLARGIRDLLLTGRLPILDRLRGESDPITVLRSVPGIGHVMAARLVHELGIESLEDLELAAHDGRLDRMSGFGPKTVAGIRDCLATRLGRLRLPIDVDHVDEPPVGEILDVDAEYRRRVSRGELHRIAPRRFNSKHEAWLPILHTVRGERHYTALYSNTARAHRAGRTQDWVVIYFDDGRGHQATVITAQRGPLRGKRIVRGREVECERAPLRAQARVRKEQTSSFVTGAELPRRNGCVGSNCPGEPSRLTGAGHGSR